MFITFSTAHLTQLVFNNAGGTFKEPNVSQNHAGNADGKEIWQYKNMLNAGYHKIQWEINDISKGIYFCKIIAGANNVRTEKIFVK